MVCLWAFGVGCECLVQERRNFRIMTICAMFLCDEDGQDEKVLKRSVECARFAEAICNFCRLATTRGNDCTSGTTKFYDALPRIKIFLAG